MNRIIVLEGPDGSGKTWLAESLGGTYHHEGPPTRPDLLQYYAKQVQDAYRAGGVHVFDRLHLGETIYGPVMRGRDLITMEGVRLLERQLKAYGARVIFCLPPLEICLDNWKKKHEDYVKHIHQYHEIYAGYRQFVGSYLFLSYFHWDYTSVPLAQVQDYILETPLYAHYSMVGNPKAPFMFVGDRANHEWLDLPFFALNNSSAYLNEALVEAGFPENEIFMANAYGLDGAPHPLHAAANWVLGRCVIALGGNALTACKRSGIKNAAMVPHPAFWKRFHANERHEYIQRLRDIRIAFLTRSNLGARNW